MSEPTSAISIAERRNLRRRAVRLEYATIVWNLGEAVLTIGLGVASGSLALVAFGTDSLIEVFASGVVVWHERPDRPGDPARGARALRLVGVAFFALALVLGAVAIRDLVAGRRAGESIPGIVYLALTAFVMIGLATAKLRVADRLRSAPLRSEAMLTFLDGGLAVLTLTGLALNAALGWWWADPAAALLVAVVAAREGVENLQGAAELASGGHGGAHDDGDAVDAFDAAGVSDRAR